MSKKDYEEHYDITKKMMKELDCNGQVPAFRIVCSATRGPGKSYSTSKMLFEEWLETGRKFILLTRFKGELGDIADGAMGGYISNEHPEYRIYEKIQMKGVFSRIYAERGVGDDIETSEIGWVIPLSAADQIKKISSLFSQDMPYYFYFDEFQPTDGRYLKNELDLVLSIYKSVARGDGSAIRPMEIIMCSNTISLQNPYFKGLGINRKAQNNTRFTRGDGWVYERCDVVGLKEAHASSAIERAMRYHLEQKGSNDWILDDETLVCKPDGWGRSLYYCTLYYLNDVIAVHRYANGLYYLDRKVDKTCDNIYNLTIDGDLNLPMFKTSTMMSILQKEFFKGNVRVAGGDIQQILIEIFA